VPEDPETRKASFWTSLGGILTGLAAVITAIAGLIAVFHPKTPETPEAGRAANVRPTAPSDYGPSRPVEKSDSTLPRVRPVEKRPLEPSCVPEDTV
jgi:hypothetical protein